MSDKRFSVFPTRMTLTLYKGKLKGGIRGHSLLKKKSDALTIRFRSILGQIIEHKESMGDLMKSASFVLIQAKRDTGDMMNHTIIENVKTANYKVRLTQDNIAGVRLPVFQSSHQTEGLVQDLTGLAKGGQRVAQARIAFTRTLDSLVTLASLQTAFVTLDGVIKVTNRRVNALEYVMIPKFENTIHYIESELDESDREEFFRLKKVQGNKKKQAAKREAEQRARQEAHAAERGVSVESLGAKHPRSLIGQDDEDDDTKLF